MTWLRLGLAAPALLAGSLPASAANQELARLPFTIAVLFVVAVVLVVIGDRAMLMGGVRRAAPHLNRPERERGSVLSTVVRHTALGRLRPGRFVRVACLRTKTEEGRRR